MVREGFEDRIFDSLSGFLEQSSSHQRDGMLGQETIDRRGPPNTGARRNQRSSGGTRVRRQWLACIVTSLLE